MSSLAARPTALFRALALAETVTWTLLIAGMLGKYVLDLGQLGVRIGGSVHGLVFLAYCLVVTLIGTDQQWRVRDIALGIGSAVVPYLTIPFERYAERRRLLDPAWRLRTAEPRGVPEKVTAVALRRPLTAAAVGALAVGLTFTGLVQAGPPTQWFG